MKRLFLILLLLALPRVAEATTYYVATTGTNSDCTTIQTIGTPALTMAFAIACAGAPGTDNGAGDTVQVAAGTYSESLTNVFPSGSGTGTNVFTLKCVTDRACTNTRTGSNRHFGFTSGSGHYITIRGFVMSGGGDGITFSGGSANTWHDFIIQNNSFLNLPEGNGIVASGTGTVLVSGNIMDTGGLTCGGFPGLCHGIYLAAGSDTWTIINNDISRWVGNGLQIQNSPTFGNNVIGNVVHHNESHGIYDSTAQTPFPYTINNVVYNNGQNGIFGCGYRIWNNTVYNNGYGSIILGYSAGLFGIEGNGCTGTVKNNLVIGNSGGAINGVSAPNQTTNITTGTAASHFDIVGTHLTLKAGSGAIGAGTTITSDFTAAGISDIDINNLARTAPWDVGAYKYKSRIGVHTSAVSSDGNQTTTSSIDTSSAKAIIYQINADQSCSPTPTDSKGNAWTLINSQNGPGGSGVRVSLWMASGSSIIVGTGHTFSTSAGLCYYSLYAVVINSDSTTSGSTLDTTTSSTSTSATTIQGGNLTATSTNEIFISALGMSIVSGTASAITDGFTIIESQAQTGNSYGGALAYKFDASASSHNPTWTYGPSGSAAAINATLLDQFPLCAGASPNWVAGSWADVPVCHSAAIAGDTITVAAGTFNATSATTITKAITLAGAGSSSTIISNGSSGGTVLNVYATAGATVRVTGFQFTDNGAGNASPNGNVTLFGTVGGNIRIDNNIFNNLNYFAITAWNVTTGVMDHNTINFGTSSNNFIAMEIFGPGGFVYGDQSWADPIDWSSANWFFVESNTFSSSTVNAACNDGWIGTRAVFRNNTLTNCLFENHGTESSGRNRGGLAMQSYRNTTTGTATAQLGVRSGSALAWGNTTSGSAVAVNQSLHRSTCQFGWNGSADGTHRYDVNFGSNPVAGPFTAQASGSGTLVVTVTPNPGWAPDQWVGYELKRTGSFTGQAQGPIIDNDADTITIYSGEFGGVNPDCVDAVFGVGDTFVINQVLFAFDQPGRTGGTLNVGSSPYSPIPFSSGTSTAGVTTINLGQNPVALGFAVSDYISVFSYSGADGGSGYGPKIISSLGGTTITFSCSGCAANMGTGEVNKIPAAFNDQVTSPIYQWLNVQNGSNALSGVHETCYIACSENSTYYNYGGNVQSSTTLPFNGTKQSGNGIGVGPIGTRPLSCTTGVAFWATNEGEWDSTNGAIPDGKMYICEGGAWASRYGSGSTSSSGIPFTFPHPLTNSSVSSAQYAFLFRNDDGTEVTATPAAAENVNYSIQGDTVKRIRIGVDTTSTLGPQTFQLESKLSTDSTYVAVPTSVPTQQTVTLTSSQSWTVPAFVTTIQAECVGGGGAGARSVTASHGGGGGKGGTYTVETAYTVTPGASLTATVGAGGVAGVTPTDGAQSSLAVGASTICSAAGGASATNDSATGASTTVGSNVGDTTTAGTSGSSGSGASSGAGGAGGVPLGGAGGASVGAGNAGINGTAPGGGGSGGSSSVSTQQVTLTNASPNWAAPAGVTTVTSAACRGPGANGASDTSAAPQGAAGGGGGAYAVRATIGVTAGNNYNATVPAGGSQSATSWTGNAGLGCSAAGATNPGNDAVSSTGASTGTGDTVRSGGNGGTVSGAVSTGGGEGACSTANGASSTGSAGGSSCDGGNGGAASTGNSNGSTGVNPGGGGGGGRRTSGGTKTGGAGASGNVLLTFDQGNAFNGGNGAAGQIKITYTASPAIVYATSANIAAGGNSATTGLLTAPTGKTSAVFTGGKISDDTNPFPSVTIQSSGYSEFEAAFKVVAANSVVGNAYDIRLTKNGTALDTYSNVPRVTYVTGTTYAPETLANGTGVTITTQNVEGGAAGTVTAYCIQRDSMAAFVANVACTWSLTSKTAGVVDGDLVPAGDFKSAVFTGHALGTAIIHIDNGGVTGNSGTLTVRDTTVPTAGGGGAITTSGITTSNITLNWTKATDLVYAQNTLQYEIRRSSSNNINSVANAEANGVVQGAYTTDIATFNVTGPGIVCNTTFWFAIIVKDGSSNKGFYSPSISATTSACPTAQPHASRRRVH